MNTFLREMPEAEYHADPFEAVTLSASIAKVVITQSPAHAYLRHPRLGGKPFAPSEAMDEGSLIHALVLDPNNLKVHFVDADSFRTKAAREERDEARAAGKTPILAAARKRLCEAADIIGRKLRGIGVHTADDREIVATWQAADGVRARGRMDVLSRDMTVITDLKTTFDANPGNLGGKMVRFGYDIQAGAYVEAVETIRPDLVGRVRFRWVFAETSPPYAISVCWAAPSLEELGKMRWRRAVGIWRDCLADNHWPDYGAQEHFVEAPSWAMADEHEREDDQ